MSFPCLLIGQNLFCQLGALGLAQVLLVRGVPIMRFENRRREARTSKQHLDGLVVRGRQSLPAGNGEPAFGAHRAVDSCAKLLLASAQG